MPILLQNGLPVPCKTAKQTQSNHYADKSWAGQQTIPLSLKLIGN